MIQLTDIHKAFNQGQHNEYWALSGIDLELEARRVTAFQGPSGCGRLWCRSDFQSSAKPLTTWLSCAPAEKESILWLL